jgi:D-tyrosyl-tRNA(Tyr) deacylase
MKAVVQRVLDASVTVCGEVKGRISAGLLVYLGVAHDDGTADADWLADKITNLRIFNDSEGKMNLSLHDYIVNQSKCIVNNMDINHNHRLVNKNGIDANCNPQLVNENGVTQDSSMVNKTGSNTGNEPNTVGILAVSQFTLLGDARKGRRPSWGNAAPPDKAKELYMYFMEQIREKGFLCESGEFQARMEVRYTNDGPVTILLDSKDVL